MDNYQRQQRLNTVLVPILAILSGLLVAAVLILFTANRPLRRLASCFALVLAVGRLIAVRSSPRWSGPRR
jgi:ABC-type uncharacterized transport system permease subunit